MKKKEVIEMIANAIEEEGYTVDVTEVHKNNGVNKIAILLNKKDSNVVPNIYIDEYVSKIEEGDQELQNAVNEIIAIYEANKVPLNQYVLSDLIGDFEKIKDKIYPRLKLINWNKNIREDDVFIGKISLDFYKAYAIELGEEIFTQGSGSITITNKIIENWGTSPEEMEDWATINFMDDMTIFNMTDVLKELAGKEMKDMIPDEETNMYVVSRSHRYHGGDFIGNMNAGRKICDVLDTDRFVLIPSSIHECIVMKGSFEDFDRNELIDMINDVNEEIVDTTERLSFHPYEFSLEEGWK